MSHLTNWPGASTNSTRTGRSMPRLLSFSLAVSIAGVIFQGCGQSKEEMEHRETGAAMADSINSAFPGIAGDTVDGMRRNFIRQAALTCKVEDVLLSTKRIEDLVALYGGYVSKSDLSSVVSYQNSLQFMKDSILESTFYTTTSAMVMHVPVRQLDTLVRGITGMAVFVDARRLSADDVKMQLFANTLAQQRLEKYNRRVEQKAAATPAPFKHITAAEDALLQKQTQADEKKMESYGLVEQVNYSTVTLELYQAQQEKRHVIAAPFHVKPYEPGFAEKLGTAFTNGFDVLKACILFLISSWGFFLVAGVLFYLIRKGLRYSKSRAPVSN